MGVEWDVTIGFTATKPWSFMENHLENLQFQTMFLKTYICGGISIVKVEQKWCNHGATLISLDKTTTTLLIITVTIHIYI